MGGRWTLFNSVLTAIPTYYLSVLHLPTKVEQEMDKIRCRFLWKSPLCATIGYCLAKWQTICRSKEHDGLGIINLRNFSLALKCKLLCQLFANNSHLKWPELVKSKYFFRNQSSALLNVVTNKSSPLWQELRVCFPIVNAFSRFRVNNGDKTIFWESR